MPKVKQINHVAVVVDDMEKALSFWRDEQAVTAWRTHTRHREGQVKGRTGIFADYRLRVASVLRDYGLTDFYLELSTKPEGKALLASAKQILANLGKKDTAVVTIWAGRSPMTRQNRPAMAAATRGSRTMSLIARSMVRFRPSPSSR